MGLSNREICRQKKITPNTVKTHLRNIFAKLGVSNRSQATTIAMRRGLIGE
jgi:DNA-binding CsgD family transcriptional regulator